MDVGHNWTRSFEDESKIGRATRQPWSKKIVLCLGLFTRWEESETGLPTTQASLVRLCFARTANVKLKSSVFLESMKPV